MPLTVHFLNVGEGDCTIIEHASGRISVVDLSNIKSIDKESAKELLISEARERKLDASEITESLLIEALSKAAPLTEALDYYDTYIGHRQDISG
jgi:competence protein ComEC